MHNYCLLCFVNCHHSWHLFNNYKWKKWRTIFCIEKKYTPLWKIIPLSQAFFERHEGMQNPISAFSNPILCSLFLQKNTQFLKKCNYSTILVNAKILTPLMNPKSMQARKWCPRKIHEPRWRRKKRFTLLFYL